MWSRSLVYCILFHDPCDRPPSLFPAHPPFHLFFFLFLSSPLLFFNPTSILPYSQLLETSLVPSTSTGSLSLLFSTSLCKYVSGHVGVCACTAISSIRLSLALEFSGRKRRSFSLGIEFPLSDPRSFSRRRCLLALSLVVSSCRCYLVVTCSRPSSRPFPSRLVSPRLVSSFSTIALV